MSRSRAIVASYIGVLFYAAFIFLGAWKIAYWQGQLYVALALAGTTMSHVLARKGSDLTVERARQARAGQEWDRRILGAYFFVSMVAFVTAGLDSGRYGWSGEVPIWITIVGVILMLLGQLIFALARRENDFFSSTVRIQSESGHQVSDTGLYHYVRHPGYLGMLLSLLAFRLVMNSYWAFIPVLLGLVLLILRTVLEDRFLVAQLAGYEDYAKETRWRLVPAIF